MFVTVCILCLIVQSISAAAFTPRINGGQESQIEQFPYVASLRELGDTNQYKHLCGAVIISPKYLLTAAQCFHSQQVSWFGITVGTNKKNDETVEVHGIKRILVHESYDAFTAPFKHDIALIELDLPLKFNERVNQIPINGTFFEDQVDAITIGFGGVYDNITKMQSLKVKTMTNTECRSKVNKLTPVYDYSTLCAYSGDPKKRIGHNDAGGPLVHENKLIGLISWNPQVVGSEKPEGFTRISTYYEGWIKKNMK